MKTNKKTTTEVTRIKGYIQAIQKFSGNNIFYRGHSNKEYELKPGIYRGDIIKNEDKIYRETIAKVPYDFKDKNTIESLALMQHYGIPTRILDLTTNALVALYFACIGNEDKDGEVIVFDIPEENTCYFDSDRVTILANLAKSNENFYYRIVNLPKYKEISGFLGGKKISQKDFNDKDKATKLGCIYAYIHCKIDKDIKNYIDKDIKNGLKTIENKLTEWFDKNKLTEWFDKNKQTKINIDKPFYETHFKNEIIEKMLSIIKNDYISKRIDYLNKEYFGKLLHNIREDKPYFQSIIDPDDINNIFAVQPKLDNPRIVRQHGAFLIFGIKPYEYSDKEIKPMPEINPDWIISNGKDEKNKRIIIKGKEKKEILKELEIFGINKSFLFPEIDKVAEDIKEKYNTKKII